MHGDSPTCPGPLCHSHNLWSWHRTNVRRTAISGYHYGRLPDVQKTWLQPESKRDALHFASYDVVELQTLGKYANVTPDFCTNGFLESVSWAWSGLHDILPDSYYLVVLPGVYYLIVITWRYYLTCGSFFQNRILCGGDYIWHVPSFERNIIAEKIPVPSGFKQIFWPQRAGVLPVVE